ncbi:RNA polymerase sigma factor [Fictibacillus aquaticus]|uniref:RNA polymerase subunit sigma n=1 Tax=Fictibacillus aquaticus TaxID=2021314 RepID=A0A235F6H0_9BACL|nr:RNA polymerase sigma factor [Fictibacillus aquaticus]OYD56754.1 RNA polymerase subunit sigma [Fictibacillus aquaticus]
MKKDYEKMEELYELYEQNVYYVTFSVLHNIQQAEDAVQETFMTLYSHLDDIRSLNSQELKRYILRIAKNKAIDSYRKNKRHGTFIEEYQKEAKGEADAIIENWEQSFMSEIQLDTLLKTLKESYKLVFKYKVFYDLNYQEISSLMGISEVNVRKQFERARKQVLTILGGKHELFEELRNNG